jgi:hypothetical protein
MNTVFSSSSFAIFDLMIPSEGIKKAKEVTPGG